MIRKRYFALVAIVAFSLSQFVLGQEAKHFTADRHVALGLKCDACHGEGKKQPVKSEKCLGCHQSFEEVAKRTQDIVPNPHSNHITESGDLECTQCHQGHKADIIYCANCHSNISFKRHSATPAGK